MRRTVLCWLALPVPAWASSLGATGGGEAAGALKEVLVQGATRAVELLGRPDGFLGNAQVRIPLPDGLRRVERMLRAAGMGRQVDELVTSMNRAAEQAVPQAKSLLLGAVRQMTVSDAKAIVQGGDDSVTRYFRDRTADELGARFLPVVRRATERVQLAQQYDRLAGQASQLGLIRQDDARIDAWVTRKAIDGLFVMIAEEERAIRADPARAVGDLARRVFGAMR